MNTAEKSAELLQQMPVSPRLRGVGSEARYRTGGFVAALPWLLAVLLVVTLFTFYPVVYLIWTSFHQVLLILPGTPFIGLRNYLEIFKIPYFWEALRHTFVFVLGTAPLIVVISLVVARLLMTNFVGRGVLRSVLILPWVLPGAISGAIWMWVFQPSWGILNGALYKLGIIKDYIPWLQDPVLANVAVMVAYIWTQFPFASVFFMAALGTIDPFVYEAAELDGATIAQKFSSITFPQIKPMLVVVATYELLTALTSYDLTYAMTGGGPGSATTLLSYYIYKETFVMLNFGTGAALSVITVFVSLGLILAILKAIPTQLVQEAR